MKNIFSKFEIKLKNCKDSLFNFHYQESVSLGTFVLTTGNKLIGGFESVKQITKTFRVFFHPTSC